MIVFWVAAALLSAGAASFIVFRAAHSAEVSGETPELAVYRRQLVEIDDLSERGLLALDQRRSARAEAARRLLSAADRAAAPQPSKGGTKIWVAGAAAVVPLIALGLYLVVGSPGAPDQPFAKRVASWRADLVHLDAPRIAVVLEAVARENPNDPQLLFYLSRAQLEAGDPFSAERNLKRAISMAPKRADLWDALGEVLAAETPDAPSADARRAFERAAALDPAAPAPRYFLARDRIASGDVKGGLAALRALRDSLAMDDPRRGGLSREIAGVEQSGGLAPPAAQPPNAKSAALDGDQNAFIAAMVARLAARLAAAPDDPAGWVRLIHSYQVLGDIPKRDAATARAKALFKGRPDVLRLIDQAGGDRS